LYVITNEIRKKTSITIIYPEEKILLNEKRELRSMINSTVLYYKSLIEKGQIKWRGDSVECRAKQMKNLVEHHFYIDYSTVPERLVNSVIEDMI
jgi:phage pi2 protein 07